MGKICEYEGEKRKQRIGKRVKPEMVVVEEKVAVGQTP